jgi:hypothetical protein
VICYLHHSQMN